MDWFRESPKLAVLLTSIFVISVTSKDGLRICKEGTAEFLPRTVKSTTQRLTALRAVMKNTSLASGGVHAYIIPSADAHQSEYVAPEHKRREYISGFSGSSLGAAVVTQDKAALWTDGRYFLQAEMELDCNWIVQKQGLPNVPTLSQWLGKELTKYSSVGVDPFLISTCEWERIEKALLVYGMKLVPITRNLVDFIWTDRPHPQPKPLMVHKFVYTGKSWEDKMRDLRYQMEVAKSSAVVLQALDEIAWLFNLRGFDMEYSPVFFSYAVITMSDIMLFVDPKKVTDKVKKHLRSDYCQRGSASTFLCVLLQPYCRSCILYEVSQQAASCGGKIWITPQTDYGIAMMIPKPCRLMDESPIVLPKAIKNPTEISGMRNANLRESVAWCEYLTWLEKQVSNKTPNITEMKAEEKLNQFRRKQKNFVSQSYAAISGFGASSAVIHRIVNNFTNTAITDEDIYLLDSGGQYLDGTTDTTRTLHFGTATDHQKDIYTRVLIGHIDIAKAVFPDDTFGRQLDIFAREPLWKIGLDYRHGTGHGIGHFLHVHEGPHCIAQGVTPVKGEKNLMPGMVVTIEPGFYEDGAFGIRHETAVLVVEALTPYHFDGKRFLAFEPLVFVPFQTKMIKTSMLSKSQIDWLNNYHLKGRLLVGAELLKQGKNEAHKWLIKQTEPIK